MTIQALAVQTVEAMLDYGLKPVSVWDLYGTAMLPVVRAHEENGKKEFDREIVTAYVHKIENRVDRGEIKQGHYKGLLRGVQRLTEMHDKGKLDWTAPKLATKFKLNTYFETIVNEFLSDDGFSVKGRSNAIWVARKYFAWLILEGHNDLDKVGVIEIQKFMIYCSNHMRSTSVHDVKLYMKKLYRFLSSVNYSPETYEGLFNFKVSRESKLYPAASPEEVTMTLDMIDRHTTDGKRDYAMIMLGVAAGLRACDIVKLKLADIDWERGEIKLAQAKTSVPLALPLTKDVGKAIQDYIINGRPESNSDAIFLTLHRHRGFKNSEGLRYLYKKYRIRANLPRNAFDGKGFHSLRRATGKNLVTAGVPVETVAQIFGDNKLDSVKKYIALDSRHLKECALDFSGLPHFRNKTSGSSERRTQS